MAAEPCAQRRICCARRCVNCRHGAGGRAPARPSDCGCLASRLCDSRSLLLLMLLVLMLLLLLAGIRRSERRSTPGGSAVIGKIPCRRVARTQFDALPLRDRQLDSGRIAKVRVERRECVACAFLCVLIG